MESTKTPLEDLFFHVNPNQELCKDGKPHDWQGWRETENGGTTICSKCGMDAISHSLMYGL